jgi:hypothetical protein
MMRALLGSLLFLCGCAGLPGMPAKVPLAPLPSDLSSCAFADLRSVSSEYDPVTDSTTAFVDRLRFGDVYGTKWHIVTQAKHAGRASGARVQPRFWVDVGDPVSASSPAFVVLVDDSVRFAWQQLSEGFQTVKSGFLGAESDVEYHFYLPPLTEYARFGSGKKATVAFAHLRQDLAEKDLHRFGEMYLWAQCPPLRSPPTVRK